jgi:hypothetical protein
MLLELGGQTGRPGLVASVGAVLYGDFHSVWIGVVEIYAARAGPLSEERQLMTAIAAGSPLFRYRLPAFDGF